MKIQNNNPNGWESVELGNLIVEKPKSKLKVGDATTFGGIPFFTSGDNILEHNEIQVTNENIFLATGGVANVKYFDGNASYSTDTYAITTTKNIQTKYLYYFIENLVSYINFNYFQGSGLKHLQKKDFKKHIVCFPISLAEQEKVASILSQVDAAIAHTKALIQKHKRIKTGLMQDLLTKGIDQNGNIRQENTHQFKDSPIGRIPKEWECKTIGEIYDLKSGFTPLRSIKQYFSEEGYNWIKTLDLNEDYLFESEEKVTQFALDNTSFKLMPINSILIAMYGGWEQIGRTAILKKAAGTNQAITCLYNSKIEMNADFVQFLLQNYRYKWKQFAISTRKDPNISKSDIENFFLLIPNINEQNTIAMKIISLKSSISAETATLSKLLRLKSGLMQDLLSGKVRV